MASILKIKRSAVAGKRPTTSNIETGEVALNTADGRLFSSDGSEVFEIGANVHSLSVGAGGATFANGAFTLPTSDGTVGQVLKTDGNGNVSWGSSAAGAGTFNFVTYDGTSDGITVAGGAFPFITYDGTSDSISVS